MIKMLLGTKGVSPTESQLSPNIPTIPVLTEKPNPRSLGFCGERETDILDDDEEEGQESQKPRHNKHDDNKPKYFAPLDDPLLSEDIMSCISALDEVIAEFDDPSLPYIYEDEIQQASTNFRQEMSSSSSEEVESKRFSVENTLVLNNDKTNEDKQNISLTSTTSLSGDKMNNNKGSGKSSSQSHLIQIPVSSSTFSRPTTSPKCSSKSSKSTTTAGVRGSCVEKAISSLDPTPLALSSKLQSKPSVVPRTSSDRGNGSKVSKPEGGAIGGGTYSKGTNYEIIILPRIPSSSEQSSNPSSSRNHVPAEPIYSSIGKSRPQLSLGIYTSEHGHSFPPQEPEIDYNEENNVKPNVYNANDHNVQKRFSVSALAKSISSGSTPTPASPPIEMTKELWNFPSEKNLPRSLRKTRKTCFLDDTAEGEKSDGRKNSGEVGGICHNNGVGVGIASGHSSVSSNSSKCYDELHLNNGKKRGDGSRGRIYEELVAIPSSGSNAKANNLDHQSSKVFEGTSPSLSTSSSISFSSFSNSDPAVPLPKPRLRQQIPKADETCHVKYPPGKIPKPNPKPGSNQIEVGGTSSPFSPVPCEISRTEDGSQVMKANKVVTSDNVLLQTTKQEHNEGVKMNLNNNNGGIPSATNNGHMMRMMMMMKPSAKNNSTGSTSSISRSSSSSSGGDPNYYRKDNLSSSSGVVVTTNSSTTTASPTHSVNNNSLNLNNNITIINTEQVHGGPSTTEVKGQSRQRAQPGGNKSAGCQVRHLGANIKPTILLANGGVLDVDDGYLSMINRNEAPLLWPEEFIENETFSPDELKRLSVHLPEEEEEEEEQDTSPSDSDSEKEIELEIVDYDREPSRRLPNHNRPRKQHASSKIGRGGTLDKAEYFSDDSLEGEREIEMHFQKGASVSPYLCSSSPIPKTHNNLPTFVSPQNPYYRQQIASVNNTAFVQPTHKGQMSRIPKKISGLNNSTKKGSRQNEANKMEPEKRKPCSFFVSLTDGGSSSEVNSANKSSSLPMGSKIAVSPGKLSLTEKPKPPAATSRLQIAETSNKSNAKSNKGLSGSNLPQPQLRHTKSINIGAPRSYNTCNNNPVLNANKRKSTSDLVTVVTLNNQDVKNTDKISAGPLLVTTSFNRTSTFLIPSPCSRTAEENVTGQKRPRDDETDNDEDDFSPDFINSTEPDSLQPLSLTDVHDFVSEIMDTALRQEIKRTQMALNNYPLDLDNTTTNTQTQLIHKDSNNPLITSCPTSQVKVQQLSNFTLAKEEPQDDEEKGKSHEIGDDVCDNNESVEHVKSQKLNGEERARVAEQLEAVVSNFLSDNQRFLGQSEECNENELEKGAGDECQEINTTQEVVEDLKVLKLQQADPKIVEKFVNKDLKTMELDWLSGSTFQNLSSPDDTLSENMQPLMNSTPIPNSKSCGAEVTGSALNPLKDSSLVGEEKILDNASEDEDSEEQPPEFIPSPPPHLISPAPVSIAPLTIPPMPQKNFFLRLNGNGNLHHLHNSNVREGKAALDILAERINNSKKFSPDDQLPVSHFIHDKRNIWAMYDRPDFDEDMLTVNHGARGYASRSQENLMDAMSKERFTKSFSGRGQSSTLPLNCRPPSTQRRSSTFRNMFNKFRKSKPSGPVIKEIPEYHDDEVQSITSRETGPSEQGKKRGFFSRLFRRSRKH